MNRVNEIMKNVFYVGKWVLFWVIIMFGIIGLLNYLNF